MAEGNRCGAFAGRGGKLRVRLLGRSGAMRDISSAVGRADPIERRELGRAFNEPRSASRAPWASARTHSPPRRRPRNRLRLLAPGPPAAARAAAPAHADLEAIKDILIRLGFEVAFGPEVERDYYNFEALNIRRTIRRAMPSTRSSSTTMSCCAARPARCRSA